MTKEIETMNAPESRVLTSEPGNGLMPMTEFFTPEYHKLEKERVFKKCWLRIGNEAQLPNVGDYFVRDIAVLDTSIIVVRGRDKKIRAFHNNCTHRSNRVAYEPSGNLTTFRCRFHSWAFGLDGRLMALPDEHMFPGLVKAEHGLPEVACDTWEGFIFINVDAKPAQTLREYLGEEIYNGYNGFFSQFSQVAKFSVVMQANWKVCLDAFIETYHFSTVHKESASNVVVSREFPNGRVGAFREFGRHRIVSAMSNNEHKPTLGEMLCAKYSGGAVLGGEATKKVKNPPQINPENLEGWLTDILVIFPMANIQPLGGFWVTQNYWPLGHDKTLWEMEVHMKAPQNGAEEIAIEYNRNFLRDVIREDLQNLAWVQGNLTAGSRHYQVLGENEVMIRSGYRNVAEQVGCGW